MPGSLAVHGFPLDTLPRFASTLVRVSPRRLVQSVVGAVVLALAEGAGLLLLIPLLQFSILFRALRMVPTLPMVLGVYVGIAARQGLLCHAQGIDVDRGFVERRFQVVLP